MIRNLITFLLFIIYLSACGGSGSNSNSAEIKYAALGASDATGIGATPLTNGYVYLIEEGIETRGKETELENLGIPGADIGEILDLETALLSGFDANLITLFTGANDLIDGDDVGKFETDLSSLLTQLRENSAPGAILAVATLPDLTQVPRFVQAPDPDVTPARVSAFNDAIRRQAQAAQALVVDLFPIPAGESVTRDEDGFHPNDAGHRLIADAFLAVLIPRIFPGN